MPRFWNPLGVFAGVLCFGASAVRLHAGQPPAPPRGRPAALVIPRQPQRAAASSSPKNAARPSVDVFQEAYNRGQKTKYPDGHEHMSYKLDVVGIMEYAHTVARFAYPTVDYDNPSTNKNSRREKRYEARTGAAQGYHEIAVSGLAAFTKAMMNIGIVTHHHLHSLPNAFLVQTVRDEARALGVTQWPEGVRRDKKSKPLATGLLKGGVRKGDNAAETARVAGEVKQLVERLHTAVTQIVDDDALTQAFPDTNARINLLFMSPAEFDYFERQEQARIALAANKQGAVTATRTVSREQRDTVRNFQADLQALLLDRDGWLAPAATDEKTTGASEVVAALLENKKTFRAALARFFFDGMDAQDLQLSIEFWSGRNIIDAIAMWSQSQLHQHHPWNNEPRYAMQYLLEYFMNEVGERKEKEAVARKLSATKAAPEAVQALQDTRRAFEEFEDITLIAEFREWLESVVTNHYRNQNHEATESDSRLALLVKQHYGIFSEAKQVFGPQSPLQNFGHDSDFAMVKFENKPTAKEALQKEAVQRKVAEGEFRTTEDWRNIWQAFFASPECVETISSPGGFDLRANSAWRINLMDDADFALNGAGSLVNRQLSGEERAAALGRLLRWYWVEKAYAAEQKGQQNFNNGISGENQRHRLLAYCHFARARANHLRRKEAQVRDYMQERGPRGNLSKQEAETKVVRNTQYQAYELLKLLTKLPTTLMDFLLEKISADGGAGTEGRAKLLLAPVQQAIQIAYASMTASQQYMLQHRASVAIAAKEANNGMSPSPQGGLQTRGDDLAISPDKTLLGQQPRARGQHATGSSSSSSGAVVSTRAPSSLFSRMNKRGPSPGSAKSSGSGSTPRLFETKEEVYGPSERDKGAATRLGSLILGYLYTKTNSEDVISMGGDEGQELMKDFYNRQEWGPDASGNMVPLRRTVEKSPNLLLTVLRGNVCTSADPLSSQRAKFSELLGNTATDENPFWGFDVTSGIHETHWPDTAPEKGCELEGVRSVFRFVRDMVEDKEFRFTKEKPFIFRLHVWEGVAGADIVRQDGRPWRRNQDQEYYKNLRTIFNEIRRTGLISAEDTGKPFPVDRIRFEVGHTGNLPYEDPAAPGESALNSIMALNWARLVFNFNVNSNILLQEGYDPQASKQRLGQLLRDPNCLKQNGERKCFFSVGGDGAGVFGPERSGVMQMVNKWFPSGSRSNSVGPVPGPMVARQQLAPGVRRNTKPSRSPRGAVPKDAFAQDFRTFCLNTVRDEHVWMTWSSEQNRHQGLNNGANADTFVPPLTTQPLSLPAGGWPLQAVWSQYLAGTKKKKAREYYENFVKRYVARVDELREQADAEQAPDHVQLSPTQIWKSVLEQERRGEPRDMEVDAPEDDGGGDPDAPGGGDPPAPGGHDPPAPGGGDPRGPGGEDPAPDDSDSNDSDGGPAGGGAGPVARSGALPDDVVMLGWGTGSSGAASGMPGAPLEQLGGPSGSPGGSLTYSPTLLPSPWTTQLSPGDLHSVFASPDRPPSRSPVQPERLFSRLDAAFNDEGTGILGEPTGILGGRPLRPSPPLPQGGAAAAAASLPQGGPASAAVPADDADAEFLVQRMGGLTITGSPGSDSRRRGRGTGTASRRSRPNHGVPGPRHPPTGSQPGRGSGYGGSSSSSSEDPTKDLFGLGGHFGRGGPGTDRVDFVDFGRRHGENNLSGLFDDYVGTLREQVDGEEDEPEAGEPAGDAAEKAEKEEP